MPPPPIFGGIVLSEYFKGVLCLLSNLERVTVRKSLGFVFVSMLMQKQKPSLLKFSQGDGQEAATCRKGSLERGCQWILFQSPTHRPAPQHLEESLLSIPGDPLNLMKDYRRPKHQLLFFSTQASSPALILENLVKPNFLNQDSNSGAS